MCLFLRARAVDKFFFRAASTLQNTDMASVFRKIQMASSEHFEYFVNFPLAGISLLFRIRYVVLRQVIANNLADTSKTEQQLQAELSIKNNYKGGLTKFRAIEHMSTRMRACEQLQKFCEHEQASTRLIFASNSSRGQILRAL